MEYSHTQKGRLHYLLYVAEAGFLAGAWLARDQPYPMLMLLGVAALLFLFTQAFHQMTVTDEGEALAVRYGPLPLIRTRIPYAAITAVERDRTSILDGWGFHWMPGRGTTFNIWGFDCVKLSLGRRVIRIGSDDAENLASFLRSKIEPSE
jgi:hypothetical protein